MSATSSSVTTDTAATPHFEPFVPASKTMTELTLRAVVLGSVLGIIFAASSVYLGLKVGLTVSASIPVAVLSITLFRWLGRAFGARPATILENNIVQTTGSAGESIAAGIAFTLPSLLVMGFDMELMRVLLVGLLGGLLGVLMGIPLRHGLMVKEHGKLAFPEGTACADVLIVGEQGGTNAKTVFLGFGVGFGYTFLSAILHLWGEVSSFTASFWGKLKDWSIGFEATPAMMGVGYIIGPRVAANMLAGGMLAFFVLVPLIHAFGDSMMTSMYPAEPGKLIKDMDPSAIRNNYILFIGAGAVATGGFIALARAIPTIIQAFKRGLGAIERRKKDPASDTTERTEKDISMRVVLFGSLALVLAIAIAPVLDINPLSAVLIVLFGFFFVTVSARITGEIGSSSNPISGMTVATLLITCAIFVAIGWTGIEFKAMALTTAALVCVAASNGGTIAQDLKTGHLVGATPRAQQIAIIVGVATSAIIIGFVLQLLNDGQTTFRPVSAPGVTVVTSADDQTMQGPDEKTYRIHYFHDQATTALPRGKYLVDDAGQLAFYVDSSIADSQNYPWRLAPQVFETKLTVPADAATELGLDRQPYRAIDLAEPQGDVPRGHWLVDESGAVRWGAAEPVAKFDAPKAQLFRLIIDGTMGGQLPWGLVLIGMFLAIMMELVGVQSLPFAVGLYLPISTSGGIFIGGLVRRFVDKKRKGSAAEAEFSPGVLMASGLIAGGAIAGVLYGIFEGAGVQLSLASSLPGFFHDDTWWPLVPFLALAALLYRVGSRSDKTT